MPGTYTEISKKSISRGFNVNAAAIPARRFCGYSAATADTEDAVDLLSVTGLAKIKGVTLKQIDPSTIGDVVCDEGAVVPVDSTAAAVAVGALLTVEQSTGKVLTCPTTAATVFEIVGYAETAVGGSGGVVMVRLTRFKHTTPA